MLFIFALRHYQEQKNTETGLLALYGNVSIAKANSVFHVGPDQKWDLINLSQQAATSRTIFSKLLEQLGGWTVNQYMTWRRIISLAKTATRR